MQRQLRRYVLPRIGRLPLDKIVPMTLRKLYADLAVEPAPPTPGRWSEPKPLGPNSIHKIAVTMGAVLGAAVSDGLIATQSGTDDQDYLPAEPRRPQGREAGNERLDGAQR